MKRQNIVWVPIGRLRNEDEQAKREGEADRTLRSYRLYGTDRKEPTGKEREWRAFGGDTCLSRRCCESRRCGRATGA